MDPITAGISSLLQMFGLEGILGSTAAAGTAGTAAAAPGAAATTAGATTAGATTAGASPGLFGTLNAAKDAAMSSGAVEGLKTILPKSSEEAMTMIKDKSGFGGIEKAYTTITDPKLDFRGKFDVLAPEAYKRAMEGQAQFGQIQQGSQPMQMPSYQQPYSPYQGGGIQEILKRQQGLLR
jgi:hypothetical protein